MEMCVGGKVERTIEREAIRANLRWFYPQKCHLPHCGGFKCNVYEVSQKSLCTYTRKNNTASLGAFAKLRKATIIFFMSVRLSACPSVHMEQLGSH
jgi:hypothetical protein